MGLSGHLVAGVGRKSVVAEGAENVVAAVAPDFVVETTGQKMAED